MHNLIFYIFFILSCFSIEKGSSMLGGTDAPPMYFTYQVLIYGLVEGRKSTCSGTIIGAAHVLTARHCVSQSKKESLQVIAGVRDRTSGEGFHYRVKEIHVPDNYAGVRDQDLIAAYDIAVVVIHGLFDNDPSITEIPIARAPAQFDSECIYSGWGFTEDDRTSPILKWATSHIIPRHHCHLSFEVFYSYEFCFMHREYESTIHDGDSGGPFVCNGFLTGVIVRGGGFLMIPGICIDVFRFKDFIESIVDNFICDLSLNQAP